MDPILEVLVKHLETLGTVAILRVNDWELPVEAGEDGKPHFIIEPQISGFDAWNRPTLTFSVSTWMNSTEASYDIASHLLDELSDNWVINDAGWIERVKALTGVYAMPPVSDRVSGSGFDAEAVLKSRKK